MMDGSKLDTLGPRSWMILLLLVGFFSFLGGTRYPLRLSAETDNGVVKPRIVVAGIGSGAPADISETVEFDQFWELWRILKDRFYKQPLDDSALLYGAMQGMAQATGDPYTVFFEPVIAEEFQRSLEGKFDGIGAEIGIKNDQLQIVAPLAGTPAESAGLLPGDAILAIDGTDTVGMTVEEAVYLIRGIKGTTVVLSIGRFRNEQTEAGNESRVPLTFDVSIIRDTIVVSSVRLEFPEEGIAHVILTHFNSDTVQEFSEAIETARERDVTGIVLDVRNNPGGFLDRAISVAGGWVGSDVVVIEQRQGEIVDEFRGTGNGRLKGIPTIVLVNGGSASASEIVAGALQDYGLATIVGTQTFGKGSVQDYTELENGTAVKITVAEWLTPNGRSLNEVGITPDVVIERTEQDYHDDRDPQLDAAIEILRAE